VVDKPSDVSDGSFLFSAPRGDGFFGGKADSDRFAIKPPWGTEILVP